MAIGQQQAIPPAVQHEVSQWAARRKNGWQRAETVGDATPLAIQHLLGRAKWDAEAVQDDLRDYIVTYPGDADAVLVLDETGLLKNGTPSAGVQRQYSGTAGRIEHCQLGVFLAYASRPRAGPSSIGNCTCPEAGRTRSRVAQRPAKGGGNCQRDRLERLAAGDGAKGPRRYDWAWRPILSWRTRMQRGFLVRRSLTERAELAYYAMYAPFNTPLEVLVSVAGSRWAIEEGFEASNSSGSTNMRCAPSLGWYRHITLALLAHAYLAVMRAQAIEIDLTKGAPTAASRPRPRRCRPTRQKGAVAADRAGGPPPSRRAHLAPPARPRARARRVLLATMASGLGMFLLLPANNPEVSTTVVLNCRSHCLGGATHSGFEVPSCVGTRGIPWGCLSQDTSCDSAER